MASWERRSLGVLSFAFGVAILCVVLLVFASWFQRRFVVTGWVPGGTPSEAPPAKSEQVAHGAA